VKTSNLLTWEIAAVEHKEKKGGAVNSAEVGSKKHHPLGHRSGVWEIEGRLRVGLKVQSRPVAKKKKFVALDENHSTGGKPPKRVGVKSGQRTR